MADGIQVTPGSGALVGADLCTVNGVANTYVTLGKLGYGPNDSFAYVTTSAGLPVAQQGAWTVGVSGSVAVTGAFYPATQPVSLASLPALAAGTSTIGVVNAQPAGDVVEIGGTTYAVKRAFVNATASGTTTVVAGVTSKKIRVLKYTVSAGGAVNVYFGSATAGAISATKYLAAAGSGIGAALSTFGHFPDPTAGEALYVSLSAAANVGVDVLYIEV